VKLNNTNFKVLSLLFFSVLPLGLMVYRSASLTIFNGVGLSIGFGWMLLNFHGFLFKKTMSMGGEIQANKENEVRRLVVLLACLSIYAMLILALVFNKF
jgi:hypothetical protein